MSTALGAQAAVDTVDEAPAGTMAIPPRLRAVEPLLRRVPPDVARYLLGALGAVDGVVRGERWRLAHLFARAQGRQGWEAFRLAVSLLVYHGRFVHMEMFPDLPIETTVVGEEHLARATAGALLLSFHLGPPHGGLALRRLGYAVRSATRQEHVPHDRVTSLDAAGVAVRLPADDARARALALLRLRRLLAGSGLVRITADGPLGREAFSVAVPGGHLVLRQGWLTLRRESGVPVLPVLTHMEGRRRVVTIHPPLPPVLTADPVRDQDVCREVLAPLLVEYVRMHPEQCRYVAFPLVA